MKKVILIVALIIFSMTSLAYEIDEQGNYIFTPEEVEFILDKIDQQAEIIVEQDKLIVGYEKEIENKENIISLLEDRINNQQERISLLERQLENREERIALLNDKINQQNIIIENSSGNFETELRLLLLLAGISLIN